MNIDLFHTGHNEAGLVCAGIFPSAVMGVILDAQTQELTLEFENGDTAHLNIPIELSHREKLLFAHRMYVGYIEDGMLVNSFEVPLLYLNDPYGGEFGQHSPLAKPKQSVLAFEQFMKRCHFAQALHRDNLGDEDSARSVLRGLDPNALQYSPTLLRQLKLGIAPKAAAGPQAPGLGGGASAQTRVIRKTEDDSKD
ncbi:MAG: hypothetical protein DI551_07200 [Micavibrio aeruginosavorus]|uniref:Uncharacterized protein n=1 Tax=Micavibrio aeruginosavorus TaxID=349221 RepID=A0A2W5PLJ9_9BACT|nr:MAG: hypothetical protein DI551_07200 [Micavibrio aeruginosavorus]